MLAAIMAVRADQLGAAVEARGLGRVPPPAEADVQRNLEAALADLSFNADVTLQSLDLMRSQPGPVGPRYTTLLAAPLARLEPR